MRLVREGVHAALASLVLMLAGCGGPPALQSSEDELSFHQKPQIVIDSPSLGGFVATSKDGTVEVSGHTRGSSLTINGRPVAVDSSGAFKSRIPATPGINFITARLNSLWGGEAQRAFVYGDFAPPAAPLRRRSARRCAGAISGAAHEGAPRSPIGSRLDDENHFGLNSTAADGVPLICVSRICAISAWRVFGNRWMMRSR